MCVKYITIKLVLGIQYTVKIAYICYIFEHPPVAQLVEQRPFKPNVVGSSPTGRTTLRKTVPAHCFLVVRGGVMFERSENRRAQTKHT